MSFPASGMIETTYRNSINEVVKFLQDKHGQKFWVFNCSERTYDHSRFLYRVSDFCWKDHHAPSLHLLFELAQKNVSAFVKGP
mmetsp:Transcript_319/g.352  ORF Transcript_319/g.352 Transcript_319/m.352 type:complete len:83 (+) Transcript_319:98-346(+)